jgi:voltage-gated potassium channel Kch
MPGTDGQLTDHASRVEQGVAGLRGHAIVAGFGIPGRELANLFTARRFPFCVVELNRDTVDRCAAAGLLILPGDATEEQVLRRAGIDRAAVLAFAMPNETAVLTGIAVARRLNPGIKILARCRHVSTTLEAIKRGADEVLSEEQVVAQEFRRRMDGMLPEGERGRDVGVGPPPR